MRWFLPALCVGFVALTVPAADTPVGGPMALSVSASTQRPAWQQHLTLGPGDSLNFALYVNDNPTQARDGVVIGPDGRVSYLQAHDIMAAGLTVDELRAKMDAELGKFYRLPRTIIIPVAVASKKYYVLGSVVNRGVYTFDRPMTVIEAIGRAGGLSTGVFEGNAVELTDLSRSFLVRHGQKLPVDFEKLFQQGDLTQNVPLEPDDYLYFASSSANEVYVLGYVLQPGIVPFTSHAGAVAAITSRGGFRDKAYKSRVLVVRGSLSHPETFVVNTREVLAGKEPDLPLKRGDIVYVSPRPWSRAEQLLDEGAKAFIEGFIVTYTGNKVGPFLNPIVP